MSDWFITDDDCLQCCRPDSSHVSGCYEFVQLNSFPGHVDGRPFYQVAHGMVRVHDDYSEKEILDALGIFGYEDMDDFVMRNASTQEWRYKEDGTLDRENSPSYLINYQLIAEMLFELNVQEYVSSEFRSYGDAVRQIAGITGLDLSSYLEQELMLVTAYEQGQEVNYLSTRDELLGSRMGAPKNDYFSVAYCEDGPAVYRFQVAPATSMIEARFLSVSDPEATAAYTAKFLTRAWNHALSGNWRNAPERTSPNAKAMLSRLLQPILEDCHSENRWDKPLIAVQWCKAHPDFVKNLDTIFSELGLLQVQRHRSSVTQGEASVMCCGKELVRYGDDQWLQLKNGKISNGFREKDGKLYGQIIGGYGSEKPDESFRRAALVQFTDRIATILERDISLTQKIEEAKSKKVILAPDTKETYRQER